MPLVNESTVRVDIEDGDWYEIREQLGWYQKKKASAAETVKLNVSTEAADKGNVKAGDTVQVQISPAESQLHTLKAYLVKWSHKPRLTMANIKRIPDDHVAVILAQIRELERAAKKEAEAVPTTPSTE